VFGFAVGLAAILSLPFCATGIFLDDYLHMLLLDGSPSLFGDRWRLFTFADGNPAHIDALVERGPLPWWTLPELHFSFFRPLTAVLANVDHALFGRQLGLHHLHSVLWYAALVAVVGHLYRRALGPGCAFAGLAALLYALDDAHAIPVGWLANRNALVAATAALLAVVAHIRWRSDGWRPGLPLSLLLAATGLAAGEVAISALAYAFAWEVLEGGSRRLPRWRGFLPMFALGIGYLVIYRWTGSGAWGSEVYSDPLRDPLTYLRQAPLKALALVGAQILGSTADLWLALPKLRTVLAGTGILAILLLVVLWKRLAPSLPEENRRALRWLSLGAGLSVLPVLATFPLNRLLLVPGVGASALVAALVWYGWDGTGAVRWGTRLLFVTTVILGLGGWPLNAVIFGKGARLQVQASLETGLSDEALAGRVLVFLAPDAGAAMYPALIRQWHGRPPARAWLTLSLALYPHLLRRVDERTVDVEIVGGRLGESVFEQLVRHAAEPIPRGFRRRLDGLELEVTALDQGLPSAFRVRFDDDPEGGSYTLARWDGDHLGALTLPPVGGELLLPRPTGLLSL
jgi:hypothetical protein